MLDVLTAPFVSLYDLIMNIFIFIIVTVVLMIVIPMIAIPFLVKMFAVYLGKTIAKELGKVATQIIIEQKKQIEKSNNV